MAQTSESGRILGPGGEFEAAVEGFRARPAQQRMAECIEKALESESIFVAESGTGTGKTFAYLVPALLSRKKVIISTGTRHLQDQLFQRDLPAVVDALGVDSKVAMLKGRSNYLCLERLERRTDTSVSDTALLADTRYVHEWARTTEDGDVADLRDLPENSTLWPLITSTAENCAGAQCGHFDTCFVHRARRQALDADLVIINHHLFFADLVLKKDGFGQLLPHFDAVVFDEAHQLADIASGFLGQSITSKQLTDLLDDVVAEEREHGSAVDGLIKQVEETRSAVARLFSRLAGVKARHPLRQLEKDSNFVETLLALRQQQQRLVDLLVKSEPVSDEFGRCLDRAADVAERLDDISDRDDDDHVRWCETTKRGFRLHSSPIDTGHILGPHFDDRGRCFIFTSATLAVGDNFDHFGSALGLADFDSARFDSPFDYPNRALLFLPAGLPDPRQPDFMSAMLNVVVDVVTLSRGRAFLLFTSHRALQEAAESLALRIDFPLLVQGQAPRNALLTEFRNTDSAVLLGTSSFWEGVDVRGEALSVVVIDKLPFEAVDDPLVRGKLGLIESRGGNPFMDYQVPRAVMALKQGAGRLIRDENDRGVLVVCDPRATAKGYGKIFLKNLPPMTRTTNIDDVREFFATVSDACA